MANVKISPLSFQSDPESKLPSGTMSGPVTDAASPPPDKRSKAARMCGCFLEVQFKTAKWLYFVGFVIQCIVSWVFRDYSDKMFKDFKWLDKCLGIQNDKYFSGVGACIGKGAVLRISFGTFLFFAAHFVALIGVTRRSNWRRLFHTGCWPAQLALWLGLVAACFAMPNSVYSGYSQFAKVAAGAFLVLVIILFVIWFYQINDWLLARLDHAWAKFALVFGTVFFYLGSLVALGFMYNYYAPKASCGTNIAFITITIILAVAYTALTLSPWRPQSAGLFVSGSVFFYCTYLTWGALTSQPAGTCVPASGSTLPIQIIGFIIAIGSVLYAAWDTVSQDKAFLPNDVERLQEADTRDVLKHSPAWFHAVLALAACYVAMTLTNWNLSDGPNPWTIDRGSFSSWVRAASSWLCALVFIWTLIAPAILRKRVFA
jgi:hypothetical protein